MQAVILAAGVGKRMQPKFKKTPKGLIRVAGREIIYRTLSFLKQAGIDEFIIVTNAFCYPLYQEFFQKHHFSCQLVLNPHPERGNGYSLYLAKDFVKGRFVLTMSDHIYEKIFIKKAVKGEGLIMDRVGRFIDPNEATKVKVENGRIAAIGKQIKKWDGFDTGFFILTPEVFEAAEKVVAQKELVELSEIMQVARVKVTEVSGHFWMDVDTPQDLEKAKRALLHNAVKGTGDGLVSRFLNRKISTYISTYVADLATPNQITIYTFVFGLFSAFIALFWPAGGGVFYQISSILDGVDGEIARASLQESCFGGWFDSLLDRFVDFAFFLALGRFLPLSSWPLIALTIFGMVMVSYSTERFKAAYQKDAYQEIPTLRYLIGKRDERIFLTMLFCLWGKIKFLFIFMALLTNLRVLLTMYLVWKYEKKCSNSF